MCVCVCVCVRERERERENTMKGFSRTPDIKTKIIMNAYYRIIIEAQGN